MITLIDTSLWSLLFRRRAHDLNARQQEQLKKLKQIVAEGNARLLGAVRQELLSGIRPPDQFARLRQAMRSFPDVELAVEDYEKAAEISHTCRTHGIAVTPIDMLLCSVALGRGWAIYASDRDFEHYAKILPIRLYR